MTLPRIATFGRAFLDKLAGVLKVSGKKFQSHTSNRVQGEGTFSWFLHVHGGITHDKLKTRHMSNKDARIWTLMYVTIACELEEFRTKEWFLNYYILNEDTVRVLDESWLGPNTRQNQDATLVPRRTYMAAKLRTAQFYKYLTEEDSSLETMDIHVTHIHMASFYA